MTRVVVFAKAPVAGQVKTRLARQIGDQAAARLAARMLDHALAVAVAAKMGPVELCGTPARHPLLIAAAERHGVLLTRQAEGNLGARMYAAFEQALGQAQHAVIIGTDCPDMTASHIREAATALAAGSDAAFIPSKDGGYVLIGLRRLALEPFDAIAWSTSKVMAQTRERLRAIGWRWWEGETLSDVDEVTDLPSLPQGWLVV